MLNREYIISMYDYDTYKPRRWVTLFEKEAKRHIDYMQRMYNAGLLRTGSVHVYDGESVECMYRISDEC